MQTLILLYRLKPSVTMEEYMRFSLELDQKINPTGPAVHKQRVFSIKETLGGEPTYQIAEVIDVESAEAYQKWTETDRMNPVQTEWERICDTESMVFVVAEQIEPR